MNASPHYQPQTDAERLQVLAWQVKKHTSLCFGAGVIMQCLRERMEKSDDVSAGWINPALSLVEDAVVSSSAWLEERADAAVGAEE
ncbi:hypothetical protein [Komagataeibacter intermedius]|uniref:hypothetical protein n=1 Tax=Komagataeibacter intermedius TaxID=66229 RepID=UPI003B432B54